MIPFTDEEKQQIRAKLMAFREKVNAKYTSLADRQKAIGEMFNIFIPELEEAHLTNEELKKHVYLPDNVRIIFYEVFPEHGLTMAKQADKFYEALNTQNNLIAGYAISLRHND